MAEWTHRICERDWFDGPRGYLEGKGFRMPVQVKDVEPGVCCECGGMTVTGIFFREDENNLPCRGRHEPDELHEWSKVGVAPAPTPGSSATGTL